MTISPSASPPAERVVCSDSLGRALLGAAVRGLGGRGGPDRGHVPVLGRHGQHAGPARSRRLVADACAEAVPVGEVARIDAQAVARWITGRYPARTFPAVVFGSPHGSAVHLATAMGAPWLPTGFTVTVPWPGGSAGDWAGAMEWGAGLAGRIVASNPDITVRQVHDPVLRGGLSGATVTLHLQWRRPPDAYRELLRSRLAPDGFAVLLRDVGTWPVLGQTPEYAFQIGTPAGGLDPVHYRMADPSFRRLMRSLDCTHWFVPDPAAPRRYAETSGHPAFGPALRSALDPTGRVLHRVLYPGPSSLSAAAAEVFRELTGAADCVVETGRLLDPWHARTRRVVPYWCESASRGAVEAAEWWLAGSRPFDSVTVLPGPPGTAGEFHAQPALWRSLAGFASRRGHVDTLTMRRYPLLPSPTSHATNAYALTDRSGAAPPRLPSTRVLAALRSAGPAWGILAG